MDYSVFDAARAGVERVVFVIRKEIEGEFHRQVGAKYAKRMDVGYAFQEIDLLPPGFAPPLGRTRPWGTGHAVLSAKGAVRGPFMVINADDFYGRSAYAVLADWLAAPAEVPEGTQAHGVEKYALVAFRMYNTLSHFGTVARGVCEVGAGGELASVREYAGLRASGESVRDVGPDGTVTEFTGMEPVSMNFWGFRPSVFGLLEGMFAGFLEARGQDAKSEFYLPSAVDRMINSGMVKVQVLETPDRWFGVTYREDVEHAAASAQELVAMGEYPAPLWGGR
jgi:NDP-sugar pyrophosphorylase family protein